MSYVDSSDVVDRLKKLGEEELTRLFMLQRPTLRRMIATHLHAKFLRRLDASDIVQEGYIRARRCLPKYLDAPSIHPVVWLRILCKQILAENIRKQLRGKRDPNMETVMAGSTEMLAEFAAPWMREDERMTQHQTIDQVRSLLSSLSMTDQEIIEMRHSDGYSFQEIADQLDIQMETAKKRYYRAIDRFRKTAGPEFDS